MRDIFFSLLDNLKRKEMNLIFDCSEEKEKIMKNNMWIIVACVVCFLVGYSTNDVAVSFPKYKVAVVDIPQILEKSTDLQNLKSSQEKQMNEINTLISKAQNEIANEQDRNKITQMESKYRKEIEDKKLAMDEDYNKNMIKITNKVKTLVSQEAKKTNYNLVLPTGMVISGGDDITQNVIHNMK